MLSMEYKKKVAVKNISLRESTRKEKTEETRKSENTSNRPAQKQVIKVK